MAPSRKTKLFLAVIVLSLAAAAWFGATLVWLPLPPESPWAAVSLSCLAGLVLAGAWLITRMAHGPLVRTREIVQAMSAGGFHNRLYVEDADDEAGRLQLDLNALMDFADEAMARQRQFVGAISHDIRTPLTIIKGDIEVALLRERTPEEYEEILVSNLEEVERIHKMVEDLVTLARADYGELGLNIRGVSLGSLLAEVRESFAEAARRKEQVLEAFIEGDIHIQGDAARIRQLLHNLVDNAVHYTPSGGRIELTLVADRERDEVQIRIRDTGVGISSQDLPHIFEPFYRGTPSRRTRHDGYGLGLSICDHIVRAHGGRISVESRQGPGSGTTFTVHVPRRSRPG